MCCLLPGCAKAMDSRKQVFLIAGKEIKAKAGSKKKLETRRRKIGFKKKFKFPKIHLRWQSTCAIQVGSNSLATILGLTYQSS